MSPGIETPANLSTRPEVAALFDPQTSGGLLLSIAQERAEELLTACGPTAAMIGSIEESNKRGSTIQIKD
jgi:selenophosphate synthase